MSAPLPPLGGAGFLRWCWRQLTSMRTALILLFLLAIAAIPGSLLPQEGNDPIRVREWIEDNPTLGPVLQTLGFFDVYASPWFAAVYLLLFISLIGCVLPRARVHWRAMRSAPPAAPRNLQRLPGTREFSNADAPDAVIAKAADTLRADRWRVVVGRTDGAEWVAAEKGYLRETGNLVFHLSLIGILIAVAVGGLFGWKGNVIVTSGGGFSNTVTQYDAWGGGALTSAGSLPPFSFTLDDFRVDFERSGAQRGAPRLFEADVTYRSQPDADPAQARIEVNAPLTVDGAKVFLVGHGYAPRIAVTDARGEVVFDDAVVFLPQDGNFTSTGVVKIPDATPSLGLRGLFMPTSMTDDIKGGVSVFPAADNPRLFLSAFTGDLGLDDGIPQSVYRLDSSRMTQIGLQALDLGQGWVLPDGSGTVAFIGWERWASFQIAYDPGKELALIAAVLAMAGLMLSLFVKRRRIWVKATSGGAGITVVQVAGLTKASSLDDDDIGALEDDISAVAEALQDEGVRT